MNWLGVILVVLLGLSTFQGLRRGLIKSVFSIAGIILAIFLATRFYGTVSGWFGFEDNAGFNAFSFIVIIIVVMVAVTLLANSIRTLASIVLLGWVDRLGGAVLGLVIGGILLGAILAFWAKVFGPGTISDSAVASFLVARFPLVLALLPSDFDSVKNFFTGLPVIRF